MEKFINKIIEFKNEVYYNSLSLNEKIDNLLSKIRVLKQALYETSITQYGFKSDFSSFLDKYGKLGELLESYYELEREQYLDLSINEKFQYLSPQEQSCHWEQKG